MAAELAPGKWELEKSENFDEYMKALGVGVAKRLLGNQSKPKQHITVVDGLWTITTTSALTKLEIKFKIGEPFDETTADDRKVKTTFTIDGNRLLQEQKGDPDTHLIREFTKDSFVLTLKVKDTVAKRYYKRAE